MEKKVGGAKSKAGLSANIGEGKISKVSSLAYMHSPLVRNRYVFCNSGLMSVHFKHLSVPPVSFDGNPTHNIIKRQPHSFALTLSEKVAPRLGQVEYR